MNTLTLPLCLTSVALGLGLALPAGVADELTTAAPGPRPAAEGTAPVLQLVWEDLDADGLQDVLALRQDGRLTLLINLGDGEFIDRSELLPAGLGEVSAAAPMDFDLDGDADLYLVRARGSVLLVNVPPAGFVDATLDAGLGGHSDEVSARWVDTDGDQLPDLDVRTTSGHRLHLNRGDGSFQSFELPGLAAPLPPRGPVTEVYGPTSTAARPPDGTGPGSDAGRTSAPSVTTSSAGALTTGAGTFAGIGPCAGSIEDQGAGGCLQASSTPQLGMLYPLSNSLFVAPNGSIGINTTTPARRLELEDTQASFRMHSTGATFGSVVELQNDAVSPTLLGGINFRDASGIAGQFVYNADDSFSFFIEGDERLQTLSNRVVVHDRLDLDDGGAVKIQAHTAADGSGVLRMSAGSVAQETVTLYASRNGDDGAEFVLRDLNGTETIRLDASRTASDGAEIVLFDVNGNETIRLDAEGPLGPGRIATQELDLTNGSNLNMIQFDVNQSAAGTGQLVMLDQFLRPSIILDAAIGTSGSKITTDVLEIKGGADLVEGFETGEETHEPGSVLAIDPQNPGHLLLSSEPYDRRVAGVISGAGGVQPGLHMGQEGVASGDTPVALTGRVYVKCSAENGPIAPGDLLTSASLAGHAMRASDPERAFGAVIGKALGTLEEGTDLVLVLVGLQ